MPEDVVMEEEYTWDAELCEYVLVRREPVADPQEADGSAIII